MNASFTLQVEQSLRNLGFTRHEVQALIYLTRVKKSTSRQLSRETAIPYSMTKAVLANLARRGLIEVAKNGDKAIYTFSGKENFQTWLREEQVKHKSIYEQASEDMEQFFSTTEEHQWQPEVLYYEGEAGIKEIYEEMLKSKEDIYCWTDSGEMYEKLNNFIPEFVKRKSQANITSYAIMPNTEKNQTFGNRVDDKRTSKLIPGFEFNGQIRIFGDKVAIMTFNEEKPVGFIIEGLLFSKLFKSIFDIQWEQND